jgi:hypothetical protein
MSFSQLSFCLLVYICLNFDHLCAEELIHAKAPINTNFDIQSNSYRSYVIPPDLEEILQGQDTRSKLESKLWDELRMKVKFPVGLSAEENTKLNYFVASLIVYYRDPSQPRPILPIDLSFKENLEPNALHFSSRADHSGFDLNLSTKLSSAKSDDVLHMLDQFSKTLSSETYENKITGVQTHYNMIKPEYLPSFLKTHYGIEIEKVDQWSKNELKNLQLSLRYMPSFYFSDRHPLTGRKYRAPVGSDGKDLELPRLPIKKITKTSVRGTGFDVASGTFLISEFDLKDGSTVDSGGAGTKPDEVMGSKSIQHDEKIWYQLGSTLYQSMPQKYRQGYFRNEWETKGFDVIPKAHAKLANDKVTNSIDDFSTYFTYYVNRRDLFDKLLPADSNDPLIRAKRDFFVHYVFHGHDISRESLDQFKVKVEESGKDLLAPSWKSGGSLDIRVDDSDKNHAILNFKINHIFDSSQNENVAGVKRIDLTLVPLFNLGTAWEKRISIDPTRGLVDSESGSYINRSDANNTAGLRKEWGDPIILDKSDLSSGLYGIKEVRVVDANNNQKSYKLYYNSVKAEDFAKGPVYGWNAEQTNRAQIIMLSGNHSRKDLSKKLSARFDIDSKNMGVKGVTQENYWSHVSVEKLGDDPRGILYKVKVPNALYEETGPYSFTLELRGKNSESDMKLGIARYEGQPNQAKKLPDGSSEFTVLVRRNSFIDDTYTPRRALYFDSSNKMKIVDPAETEAEKIAAQKQSIEFKGSLPVEKPDFDLAAGKLEIKTDASKANTYNSDKTLNLSIPLGANARSMVQRGYRIVGKAILINKDTGESVESYIDMDGDSVNEDGTQLEIPVNLPSNYKAGTYYAKEFRYRVLSPGLNKAELKDLYQRGIQVGTYSVESSSVPLSKHNLRIDLNQLTKDENEDKIKLKPREEPLP